MSGETGVIFARLREVLRREPELARDVRSAATPEAASDLLARIGALNDIPTSALELQRHVSRALSKATPYRGIIDDEALDGVSGGSRPSDQSWKSVLEQLLA